MESHPSHHHSAREDAIRQEAYLLSERAGHPAGMEAAFWTEAERMVASRSVQTPAPAAKARKAPSRSRSRKSVNGTEPEAVAAVAGGTVAPKPEDKPVARKPRSRKTNALGAETGLGGARKKAAKPAPVAPAKRSASAPARKRGVAPRVES